MNYKTEGQELVEEVLPVLILCGGIFVGLVVFIFVVTFPSFYLEGSAKAAYLKRTQGIELPWYQAAYIDMNRLDATVK